MKKTFTYGKQSITDGDIEAVIQALRSDWLTQGPSVSRFEDDLVKRFGAKAAVAVSNGTAGLHLIGLALGWQKGDLILTTPLTFLASANCALYCGADVDFVDIDEKTFNLSTEKLEAKLIQLKNQGKTVKAVVAVDFGGYPCDWKKLSELATAYKFDLVDDACHALGATIDGVEICSSRFAKAVNLSFHPVKSMTTGEGGAILSNDLDFINRVKTLRTHGITKDPAVLEKNDGPWYYEMHTLGFNYRITDFQCALGSSQLKRLNDFNKRRREIAKFYNEKLNQNYVSTPHVATNVEHAYHLYPALLKLENFKAGKKEIFQALQAEGLNLQVHYYPVPLQPYYKQRYGFKAGDFPVAENFYNREISMPVYPALTVADLGEIVERFNSVLKRFAK